MKKKIAILGSTGSIGKSTVDIIKKNKNDFDVIFLSTNNKVDLLYSQSINLKARSVIIFNKEKFLKNKNKFAKKKNKSF